MVFGGTTGSGTPTAGTEEGAGSEQGGSTQGATGKQVTHAPTVAQCWQRMSQRNPVQSRGDPQLEPGAPRPPFPARHRALRRRRAGRAAGSGKNGHMPKPFPETNSHLRGNGHAWAPSPGQGPATAPQLGESALSPHPESASSSRPGLPARGCIRRLHPEREPREHPEITA